MCQFFNQRVFILHNFNYETITMLTNSLFLKRAVYVIMIVLLKTYDCKKGVKFKRKVDNVGYLGNNLISGKERITNTNASIHQTGRGFGSLFGLGKVLNFFPVGGERECQPEGYTVARAGICLNPYDCRQRDGKAAGDCAHGLGVCCVFEVSCGGVVSHNLTYFLSPGFPELWNGAPDCSVTIEKAYAGITQLRVDFVHFTIGQPNRTTGECDEDAMILGDGDSNFTVCGQNHGQHIYYNLPTGSETREAGDLPRMKSTRLTIVMRGSEMPRLWLLRLAQMPLAQAAPHGCLQYYTENNGTIKTFNYASNGRHLSRQEYKTCVRRNTGQCTMRYSPCDPRSFRIGPPGAATMEPVVVYRPSPGPAEQLQSTTPRITTMAMDEQILDPVNADDMMPPQQEMMPVNQQPADDELEGSGADPDMVPPVTRPAARPGMLAMIWSLMPSWLWGQARSLGWRRWSPYAQHYNQPHNNFRYYGYGNFGAGLKGYGRLRCQDRITIPCESEFFLGSSTYGPGVCDPHHCGNSFCPGAPPTHCHVETSIAPFAVSVHFGPPTSKASPEENIGACLRYLQLPCDS